MTTTTDPIVKIRLKISIEGGFENLWSPKRGQIVECPWSHANEYVNNGYASYGLTGDLGRGYEPEPLS